MCSVVGCVSLRRTRQRFKLPEDPERRLEWVQFLATVNKQRFKESSWTDIAICSQHFKDDCFENLSPSSGSVKLKPGAVPSLSVRPQSDEPDTHLERQTCAVSQPQAPNYWHICFLFPPPTLYNTIYKQRRTPYFLQGLFVLYANSTEWAESFSVWVKLCLDCLIAAKWNDVMIKRSGQWYWSDGEYLLHKFMFMNTMPIPIQLRTIYIFILSTLCFLNLNFKFY